MYTGINEIQKMALPDFGLSFISVILVFGVSLEAQTWALPEQPFPFFQSRRWVHMKSSFMASAALLMMVSASALQVYQSVILTCFLRVGAQILTLPIASLFYQGLSA